MISDVLFDALAEIERYERDFPAYTAGDNPVLDQKLEAAKAAMLDLQRYLDNPYSGTEATN